MFIIGLVLIVVGFSIFGFPLWRQAVSPSLYPGRGIAENSSGFKNNALGVPSYTPGSSSKMEKYGSGDVPQSSNTDARKIVKTGNLSLLVNKAEETAERMRGVAERLGGHVDSINLYEVSVGVKSGSVTIRVPSARFDEAMGEVKKLASKIERETVSTRDVTDQFVDLEANLRNTRAEEKQYLDIMERARSVEDTLNVAGHLANVRGRIEQIQGTLQAMSREVDMSTITASLTAEEDVQVFGIRWRPLFVAKEAFRNMLSGLTGYFDAMVRFLFALPVILLWLGTIGIILYVLWKLGKRFFGGLFNNNGNGFH